MLTFMVVGPNGELKAVTTSPAAAAAACRLLGPGLTIETKDSVILPKGSFLCASY
jgi:hypothetical protein